MDGFKLTKESFMKKNENTFWEISKDMSEAEKQLSSEQFERGLRFSEEEAVQVEEKIKGWKENPALTKNVMAIVPKKSVFLTDELDSREKEEIEALKKKYEGQKLDRKTADLKKNIAKQKESRKKNAMDLAVKSLAQEKDLQKWSEKHLNKLEGLKGKKKTKHIAGLVGKMQSFVDNGLFIGNLDSDAGIMSAYGKVLKMEKDILRLHADSTFFATELDDQLRMDFRVKYDSYVALSEFLKRLVVKMAQGKKRTAADMNEINKILGESVLIQGTTAEKVFTYRTTDAKKAEDVKKKEDKLKESLSEMDLEAEEQQYRKGIKKNVSLLNESKKLKEKSKEIQDKWEKQGEETPVFDKDNKPVMVEKLNPLDYSKNNGGEWQPFRDENGDPIMIQKTEAKNKEAIRKKLKDQTERRRFGGYTEKELKDKMRNCTDEEFEELNRIFTEGMDVDTHVSGYSGEAFQFINNALRYNKYGKVENTGGNGCWDHDVEKMVNDLKKDISAELPEELCVTRHGDIGGLACMFGLDYNSVKNVDDLMQRIGNLPDNGFLIRDKAFLSTTLIKDGVAQGGFRQAQVEFRILAPKGVKGLYIEDMSQYKETEQELIFDAGTIFRVTKIDATGKWTSSKATKDNNNKVIVYMEAIPKSKKENKK